jgi:hypothetical protein
MARQGPRVGGTGMLGTEPGQASDPVGQSFPESPFVGQTQAWEQGLQGGGAGPVWVREVAPGQGPSQKSRHGASRRVGPECLRHQGLKGAGGGGVAAQFWFVDLGEGCGQVTMRESPPPASSLLPFPPFPSSSSPALPSRQPGPLLCHFPRGSSVLLLCCVFLDLEAEPCRTGT